jgi:hypothetical protein
MGCLPHPRGVGFLALLRSPHGDFAAVVVAAAQVIGGGEITQWVEWL